jgi:queuine/archaeosine tRNA-ribosyltransferase
MPLRYELQATSGTARAGKISTPHGDILTPVFMPVGTVANVKGVPQHLLEEIGVNILLSNTYHLYLRPGAEHIRKLGGLHRFMSWDRGILTDSGGFQVFSLSSLRKLSEQGVEFRSHLDGSLHFLSPERAIEAEIALGADIIMAFDECTEYPAERGRAQQSMELTLRWAERSKRYFDEHKQEVPWTRSGEWRVASGERAALPGGGPCGPLDGADKKQVPRSARNDNPSYDQRLTTNDERPRTDDERPGTDAQGSTTRDFHDTARIHHAELFAGKTQALFGIVQGGMYADLRRECAERLVEMDLPGYAIGGLSVGEPREITYEMVARTLEYLPKDKPRYVMGVGTPEEIVEYAKLGVDMMDCVMPTRAARHGLLFTSEGRVNIKGARYADDEGPLDPDCSCPVCARYTRAYLRHLYASNELLAQVLNSVHNVAYYLDTMRRVRHSIVLGEFTSSSHGVG